ncbi:hypothetical protein TPAR_03893 [Tolypocladium paradoxum]|uniref:Uncharacterized protein n=1 Tax=Tolypocladium paradoxum TaxID=94208 RepID=A0A2S4L0D1_9HYPO|nr:hypothetical protein TPAR_03893 [Tolypocladium paradoxum]
MTGPGRSKPRSPASPTFLVDQKRRGHTRPLRLSHLTGRSAPLLPIALPVWGNLTAQGVGAVCAACTFSWLCPESRPMPPFVPSACARRGCVACCASNREMAHGRRSSRHIRPWCSHPDVVCWAETDHFALQSPIFFQPTYTTTTTTDKMMAPKFYNLFAVMVMLLGLASATSSSAASSTTAASSTNAASKTTGSASVTSGSATSKASTSSSAPTSKSAAIKAADPTLITVSLAAGLISFGLALS